MNGSEYLLKVETKETKSVLYTKGSELLNHELAAPALVETSVYPILIYVLTALFIMIRDF